MNKKTEIFILGLSLSGIIGLAIALVTYFGVEKTNIQINEKLKTGNSKSEIREEKAVTSDSEQIESTGELEVEGISLSTPVETVVDILGEPIEKTREIAPSRHNDINIIYFDTWKYKSIELVFSTVSEKDKPSPEKPQSLYYISTTDEKYITKKGIRVGDSVEKLIDVYGPVEPQNEFYIYELDETGYVSIHFKTKNGKVIWITYLSELD